MIVLLIGLTAIQDQVNGLFVYIKALNYGTEGAGQEAIQVYNPASNGIPANCLSTASYRSGTGIWKKIPIQNTPRFYLELAYVQLY